MHTGRTGQFYIPVLHGIVLFWDNISVMESKKDEIYMCKGSIHLTQLIMWKGFDRYWRSGVSDGGMFSGLAHSPNFVSYMTMVANDQEIYMTITLSNDSIQARFVITDSDQIQQLSWHKDSQRCDLLWWLPGNNCDQYNSCGPFGYCIARGSEWDCLCLKGHVPENQEQWDKGNWSAGCVRKRVLDCEKGGDGFFKMEGMVLPDQPISLMESSMGECEACCQSNYSFVAYAFAIVNDTTNSTCLVCDREVIDMRDNSTRGQSLYLHVDSSELGKGSSKRIFQLVCLVKGRFVPLPLWFHPMESVPDNVSSIEANADVDCMTSLSSPLKMDEVHEVVASVAAGSLSCHEMQTSHNCVALRADENVLPDTINSQVVFS